MHDPWLGPWWLERQTDPDSPDFLALGAATSSTHRSWTLLGNLGAHDRAVVDPRGWVTPWPVGWSLDWWIGADDRWHLPSQDVAVRQQAIDQAPVVETWMRVPGGDAQHRVSAVVVAGEGWLVVEVANRTAVPFAVAFAVRPAGPLGAAPIGQVGVDEGAITVDGATAVVLPRRPNRAVVGTAATGDVLDVVTSGEAGAELPLRATCPEGRAHAAVVYPLPHTASVRVAIPLRPPPERSGRRAPANAPSAVAFPDPLPAADHVARGWTAQATRGIRLSLPDERLMGAFETARRHLLLAPAGEDLVTWPPRPVPWTEIAAVTGALGHLGLADEAAEVLATLPDRQGLDGYVGDGDGELAANGAALWAVGEHWRLTRDDDLVDALVGPLAKAGHWIERRRRGRRHPDLADGPIADGWWSAAGLHAASAALAAGQPEVAADLAGFAQALVAGMEARAPGDDPGELLAVVLDVPGIDAGRFAAAVEQVRRRARGRGLFRPEGSGRVAGAGLATRATLWLAAVELAAGDRRALDRLQWLLEVASPTGAWPEVVHPRTGDGAAGEGHHLPTSAGLCTFVRQLVVREAPAGGPAGLVLCPIVPADWLGTGWEAHDLPTAHGRLGLAVRWHGDRPALLWELDPHPGTGPVRLTTPGLDPAWSSDQPRGEVLLAPVAPPPAPDPGSDPRPGPGPGPGGPRPAGSSGAEPAAPPPPPEASSSFG